MTLAEASLEYGPIAPLDWRPRTLGAALIDARDRFGGSKPVLEDPERNPLSYNRLILGALVLGRKLIAGTAPREHVALLLPNVSALPVALLGLVFRGRVPVVLNFTAGAANLVSATRTAEVKTIVTSRRFIESGKLDDVLAALAEGCRVVYLEDVRRSITSGDKLRGFVQSLAPRAVIGAHRAKPFDAAVVLFTSGTEGSPKGVVLSHANLVANAMQVAQHASGQITPADTMFNPLPMFHSFGLTAGLLFPLLNGIRTVLYPSPLHYKQVPKLIRETGATVLVGTDTFLQGYARAAAPGDLDSVRIAVAGAERVKDETRALWSGTGTVLLEGYGATECSPVICCNLPSDNRPGTVGRFLPGMTWRLEPVPGIHEGGRLAVRGPNVMGGYLFADQPGRLRRPDGGWHDTGDIVSVSEDGFCRIAGRAKRFAKIGGEMVSLAAVEALAAKLWPSATHVAVVLADKRKGEQIVLVSDRPDAERDALAAFAKQEGVPELWLPRAVLVTGALPVLGSGKIDYAATTELATRLRSLM